MEGVHGVDVSWMSKHGHNNGKNPKDQEPTKPPAPIRSPSSTTPEKEIKIVSSPNTNGHSTPTQAPPAVAPPKTIAGHRPSFARGGSSERAASLANNAQKSRAPTPNISRRNSWLSSISSKFSSSSNAHVAQHTPPSSPPVHIPTSATDEPPVPVGPSAPKNAILQHAVKVAGDLPYIPAPPKAGQPSFLQNALRRLSSSGGQLNTQAKVVQNGLCERRVLNVDRNRERCHISELDQTKLRRVAFCVDVEIASGPRYLDEETAEKKAERREKRRLSEKSEGEAFKHHELPKNEKEPEVVPKTTEEKTPVPVEKPPAAVPAAVPAAIPAALPAAIPEAVPAAAPADTKDDGTPAEKDTTKKKEKKKRSEEERKARKEKKRKQAEANGTLPVELSRNGSDSSLASGNATPKTQASPTTDPVRIYRRCCQLRETPILKKITEQLAASIASATTPGVVAKLDLTGYWLQLPDLVTLGDYLAVVPVKELLMENCGLTDEGVRVILCGLIAAKIPGWEGKKTKNGKSGEVPQGGVVERVVFKNNVKIGRDGWRYISTFITMCRTLKSIDLSKVPFPQPAPETPSHAAGHLQRTNTSSSITELANIFGKSIGERLAGRELELLNLAECGFNTDQLGSICDGIIKSGLRRLGIAGNKISTEAMQHVARYVKHGKCEGLDLGCNDLKDQLGVLAEALNGTNPLYALSLADCNLTPDSLWALFPALAKLENFRFIDLSQNHHLFDHRPSALSLLRRYLPELPTLKRIHLTDVSMTTDQAIALAEILPESPNLAHVNLMENPRLVALANAKADANQEEACALYASLMAAVRVSKTIICIDIEIPSPESSEIVKALAKQVIAYCLWNMERGPVAEISDAAAVVSDPYGGEKEVDVPEVLQHLVGHVEGFSSDSDDEPAPDEDYVIGGTGVVKALSICLRNRGNDCRRPSTERTFSDMSEPGSGTATPRTPVKGGKAKDMSKNLLWSARKIRARLQPALLKESRGFDRNNYQRLVFLDNTLEGMIKRFEDEYPETRLQAQVAPMRIPDLPEALPPSDVVDLSTSADAHDSDTEHQLREGLFAEDEDPHSHQMRPMLSRHNSEVSLAAKALSQEEGRMHKFGQQFRRDILKPDLEGHENGIHGAVGGDQPVHIQMLRAMVEGLGGEEIKEKIMAHGPDAIIRELSDEASNLRRELKRQDPEGWVKFKESQEAAMRNMRLEGLERNVSAIE